jgi:modulator of FtsH protease HflC
MTRSLIVVASLALLLWARTAFYTVDAAEFVYVTRFGDPVAVHDGATAAGLHVKAPWPVDSVLRIDRRVQSFDLPAVESLTRDPDGAVGKTLAVDCFVTWKIPDAEAADRFVKTVRTPEQARKILTPLINGRLAAVVSNMPLEDLVRSIDTQTAFAIFNAATGYDVPPLTEAQYRASDYRIIDERNERIRRRLLGTDGDDLRVKALAEYGIQIIDVRVRRFSYPEAVRSSIAERIRSERAKKAAEYETAGRKLAADIVTNADRTARTIEATAKAEKTAIEGRANAEAAVIRSTAYEQDREFYLFLESLRSFRKVVSSGRSLLMLSTKHPLLNLGFGGPPKTDKEKGRQGDKETKP